MFGTYRNSRNPVPKSMPKKETEMLLVLLKDIRRSAEMKNADFSIELKERTQAYRNSWLVKPLSEIIERYEDFLNVARVVK